MSQVAWLRYYASSIPTFLRAVRNWPGLVPLIFGRCTVLQLKNGARLRVRSFMDIWILKENYLERGYESCSCPIEDGWFVIDIGAGIGEFSVLAASQHPNTLVYAFEPFPESFDIL